MFPCFVKELIAFSLFATLSLSAQQTAPDLSGASLQDLTQMSVKVSSFARKDQDLWVTPAAVYVITKEDIQQSAAANIPELLRMVPGLQVAMIDASTWAVSARGFNSAYSSKLLVLIDGRTVYSEIYSGSHWDQNDLPLEEIERIEVIRGPGAAVWGTNAVNGVVNVITKRARSTLGFEESAWISRTNEIGHLQYGGTLSDRLQYRGYLFFRERRPLETVTGENAFDGERTLRTGGRIDWQRNARETVTLNGDVYGGPMKQQVRTEFNVPVGADNHDHGSVAGGYLLSRWERKFSHSDSAAQIYYDDTSRHELSAFARTRTLATEFQDHLTAGSKHDIVWGAGLRFTEDHISGPVPLITRSHYNNYLVDGFVQDEIVLVPHRLVATLGSKVEQGTLAGFQLQPSVRMLWSPSEMQSVWAAVSRAAVAPSLQDKGATIPLSLGDAEGLPVTGKLLGDPALKPETVIAYEAGYRRRLFGNLTLDVASFFNQNHRLLSLLVAEATFVPTPTPHVNTDLNYTNGFRANSAGVETSLSWKPLTNLSLQGSYTWMQVHTAQTKAGNIGLADAWSTPRNSATVSASWKFAPQWGLNSFFYHTDALPLDRFNLLDPGSADRVPALNRLDIHIVRRIHRSVEIDAGGTNLLDARHLEFGSSTAAIVPAYVPRNLFVKVKWTF